MNSSQPNYLYLRLIDVNSFQKYLLLFIVGLLALTTSCKQDPPPKFHFEYFGLLQGRYVVYDVVEITHNKALLIHDTLHYQMKTVWGETYIDNEGREGREYIIYKRDSATQPWDLTDVWYGLYDGIRAELIEENQRRVKLVFAPTLQKDWDENAYNPDEELRHYYRDIHKDTTINGVYFDSTLVVEHSFTPNALDTVRIYSTYAKYVGLIHGYFKDNFYQFGSSEVVSGSERYLMYLDHGWE